MKYYLYPVIDVLILMVYKCHLETGRKLILSTKNLHVISTFSSFNDHIRQTAVFQLLLQQSGQEQPSGVEQQSREGRKSSQRQGEISERSPGKVFTILRHTLQINTLNHVKQLQTYIATHYYCTLLLFMLYFLRSWNVSDIDNNQ